MLETSKRPHFFPGQLLDYRDFNRLARQAEDTHRLFTSALLRGGGILLQSLQEFKVQLAGDLRVVIEPGLALLENGSTLILPTALAVDLKPYLPANGTCPLFVGLQNKTMATDPYTDPEDSAIQGFLTETEQPDLVVSRGTLAPGVIELFRTSLNSQKVQLRFASVAEDWRDTIPETDETVAVIDLSHRKHLVPLTYAPLDKREQTTLRCALYRIEDNHYQCQRLFLIEDKQATRHYLSQLHAELLSVPFQPLKMAFLVTEFAENLSLYLEKVHRKCLSDSKSFHQESFQQMEQTLSEMRVRHAVPRELPFEALMRLGQCFDAFIEFAQGNYTLANRVEESLQDILNLPLPLSSEHVFGGHAFVRTDMVKALERERTTFHSTHSQARKVAAKYLDGETVERTGVFLKEGTVSIDFDIAHVDKPAVLILPFYQRRMSPDIEFFINGKPLVRDKAEALADHNIWQNRGFVIQADSLIPQRNRLTIEIHQPDLDFGFFELAVYQAKSVGGVQ
jgi:hypothetical protein